MDLNVPGLEAMMEVNNSIVGPLVDCLPESWEAAELQLHFKAGTDGAEVQLVNPDTKESGTASEDLAKAVRQLGQLRLEHHLTWKKMLVGVRKTSESWDVSVSMQ